jgi:hypothetical protein
MPATCLVGLEVLRVLGSLLDPGGHERWQGNSYNQQSYFAVAPKYWSCAPLTYQQFPPLSYNHWAPYSAGQSGHFMPKYIPQRHALRPYLHERKACFSHEARSRDAIVIQQSQSPIRKEDGNIYKGGHKFVWVPVKRAKPIPVKISDDTDDIHGPKLEAYQSAEGILNSTKISSDVGLGLVYREDAGTGKKGLDNTLAAFSSTSRKNESASMQIDSAMGGSTSGTSMRLQRMGCFKSSTSISTQRGYSSKRDSQKFRVGNASDQHRVFSAKEKLFSP